MTDTSVSATLRVLLLIGIVAGLILIRFAWQAIQRALVRIRLGL